MRHAILDRRWDVLQNAVMSWRRVSPGWCGILRYHGGTWLGVRLKAMESASPSAMMAPPVDVVMLLSSYAPDAFARSVAIACIGSCTLSKDFCLDS